MVVDETRYHIFSVEKKKSDLLTAACGQSYLFKPNAKITRSLLPLLPPKPQTAHLLELKSN